MSKPYSRVLFSVLGAVVGLVACVPIFGYLGNKLVPPQEFGAMGMIAGVVAIGIPTGLIAGVYGSSKSNSGGPSGSATS